MSSPFENKVDNGRPLSIIVIGASGDLALRKIMPALFSLYCRDFLPNEFHIVGFARTAMTNEDFRERVTRRLTCRYTPEASRCAEQMDAFLKRCTYVAGDYSSSESFRQLHSELEHLDPAGKENRIFYMSIPPFLFLDVAHAFTGADLMHREGDAGWSRVVVEKPFGRDRASSDELTASMSRVFREEQTYRIDHYLGKEVIQNLMVLRFSNLIFDPIWHRNIIENVSISWSEELGLEGRAGYFDEYGIIRDVVQNHLLQILALIAMEPPIGLDAEHIRAEKLKVLQCVSPVELDNLVVGQYTEGGGKVGYLEEDGVPKDSITPTFAAAVLHINNRRWDGVPFILRAGKALNTSNTEIRILFRAMPGNIFSAASGHLKPNELVIRVQPDARIYIRINNKVPGLGMELGNSELDLSYAQAFDAIIPEAYESLLLDVLRGDRSLFIPSKELEVAWDVFTPALHSLEEQGIVPESYPLAGCGPDKAIELGERYGFPS